MCLPGFVTLRLCNIVRQVYLPSRYSSLMSIYAYSRADPFLGSSTPCNFATKVVFPVSLSPKTSTFLFEGSFVFPWFCTSSKIADLKTFVSHHTTSHIEGRYASAALGWIGSRHEKVRRPPQVPHVNNSPSLYIQRSIAAARSHNSQVQAFDIRRCDTLDPLYGESM